MPPIFSPFDLETPEQEQAYLKNFVLERFTPTEGQIFDVRPVRRSFGNDTFFDLMAAHIGYNTPIGSALANTQYLFEDFQPDESFRPEEVLTSEIKFKLSLNDEAEASLLNTKSRSEFDFVLDRILLENDNRHTIGQFGFIPNVVASLGAAPFDPLTYLPLGGNAIRALQLSRVAKSAGAGISGRTFFQHVAESAGVGAAGTAAGVAGSEFLIHKTQFSRTFEESRDAVIGGAFFGGGFAGGIRFLGDLPLTRIAQDFAADVTSNYRQTTIGDPHSLSKAKRSIQPINNTTSALPVDSLEAGMTFKQNGKTRTVDRTPDGTLIIRDENGKVIGRQADDGTFSVGGKDGLSALHMDNESLDWRSTRLYSDAGEAGVEVEVDLHPALGAIGGMTSPAVRVMRSGNRVARSIMEKLLISPLNLVQQRMDVALSQSVEAAVGRQRARALNVKASTRKMWIDAKKAGLEMSEADFYREVGRALIDENYKPVASVAAAAAEYKKLYDDLGLEAQGVIPDFVYREDFGQHRLYVRELVDTDEFVDDLARELHAANPQRSFDDVYASAVEIRDGILSNPAGSDFVVSKRGAFKERIVNEVSPDFIAKYTEMRADVVMAHYAREIAGDIEISKAYGDPNMTQALDDIRIDAKKRIERAKTEKGRKKIQEEAERDIAILETLRDELRGINGIPDNPNGFYHKSLRRGRLLSYLARGGYFLISNIADMTHAVGNFGLRTVLREGWGKYFRDTQLRTWTTKEAQVVGEALEHIETHNIRDMGDLQHNVGTHSAVDRFLQEGTDKFAAMTLMRPWANFIQRLNGMITHNVVLDRAHRMATGGKLSKSERAFMLRLGIDDAKAKKIHKQWEEHGLTSDRGNPIANAEKWTDDEAIDAFYNAMYVSGNLNRSLAGMGDRPLWTSTNIGKSITQFMSFAFASTNKIVLTRLQTRDMAALNASVLALAIGGMAFSTKRLIRGQGLPTEEEFAFGAIDHSGLTGWVFQADQMLNRVTNGEIGLNKIYDGFEHRYYQPQDMLEAALGPTGGLINDAAGGLSGNIRSLMGDGKFDSQSVHQLRTIIPFQNVFYLDWLFRKLGEVAE